MTHPIKIILPLLIFLGVFMLFLCISLLFLLRNAQKEEMKSNSPQGIQIQNSTVQTIPLKNSTSSGNTDHVQNSFTTTFPNQQ